MVCVYFQRNFRISLSKLRCSCLDFPLFTSRSRFFSGWRYCRHSWCIFCSSSSSILVFHLNGHRIWCPYKIFIWCESYFTCQWVNRVRTNFRALFSCVNRCFFYCFSIHHEFGWLVCIDFQRYFRIAFSKLRCSSLYFSLFTSRRHIFSRWRHRRNGWRIFQASNCFSCCFFNQLNNDWFCCSCEVFIRCERYFSSRFIDRIRSNLFSIFHRWSTRTKRLASLWIY